MVNFINKNKLLATTAICAISVCANTVKAEEISILDILNNSTTKSPNITWEKVTSAGTDTIQIGDEYFKYTYTTPTDYTKVENLTEEISVVDPTDYIYKYVGLGVNNLEGTDYGDIEKTVFSNNKVTATLESNVSKYRRLFVYGGAISNRGTVGDIITDFLNNSIEASETGDKTSASAYGGAIYNIGTISSISGDFTGNSATGSSNAFGGAVCNHSTISSIIGDFVGNSATATNEDARGGAVYNSDTISSITGDFIGNSASSTNNKAEGGAIYHNNGIITSITGDFTGNSATGSSYAYGGAIVNNFDGTIETITGDFTGNSATSTDSYARGGAIFNGGTTESITGYFTGNSATSTDSYAYGGAIYNWDTAVSITGDFTGNSATGKYAFGGAVYNYGKSMLQKVVQDRNGYESFEEYAQNEWGMNGEELLGELGVSSEEEITPEIVMYMDYGVFSAREFANNQGYDSVEEMLDAYGYASIQEMLDDYGYHDIVGTINFVADASDSEDTLQDDILIKGNYIEVGDDKRYEAIYNEGIINFESNNGGSYTLYDYIDGNNGTLNFVSDDNEGATINLYNNIQKQTNVNFQNKYVMNMISPDDIHSDTSKYSYIQAKNININAALQMMLDVDLENAEMDRFEADNFTIADSGSIDVTKFNIVTDVTGDIGTTTEVEFILSDNATGLDKLTNVTEAVGEVYTYTVTFNPDTGAFEFVSTGLAPEPVTPAPEEVAPNQAISVVNTTTVAAVETVVAQIFDRDVTISTDINYGADTTDYVETADGVNISNEKSLWVKTFGSDDDVEVENFNGTIDAESYGVVGGVDSKVFTYDNGVKAAYGIYGAYVGGKQKYDDNKVEQKSGYLGVSAAFRKNNLFSNFTLNGGYVTSESNTELGKDEFDTKVVSVANKTGFDIKAGNNWTVTPAMYVAYTGMDTEDYTNKAGVKMENEFSNVVTLAPEVKVRKGFNNGIGAYAKASYKHYIYDSEVKADDIVLEEMSAKPYVEYGFGVEKNWADKSGYAELTRRDGGREGWNVNLGLNFDF